MAPTPPAERTRERLLALLSEDRPDRGTILARLREIRSREEASAFSVALGLLVQLEIPEPEAERLFGEVLRHRDEMRGALGRDPGLRVAAVDYLSNVEHRLTNPRIVEQSIFEQTERSALTDPLTGLYNRRFFQGAIEREIRRSRRYRLQFSLILLDLDHFKKVNDEYGHLFGDVVLQRVARILRQSIREADLGCRFGGEEFAVILPETERRGGCAVADRFRVRLGASFSGKPVRGREVSLTVSAGISCFPEDGQTPESLVARADEALYLAKGSGRDRVAAHHLERRASARYPVRSSAPVGVEEPGTGSTLVAMPVNLSRGGVLIEADHPPLPPMTVQVRFDGPEGSAPWRMAGRVVRVETEPGRGGARRVGIAFDAPVPDECLRLHAGPLGSEDGRVP